MSVTTALPLSKILLNAALFQLGWFACVLGGAHGWPWIGTLFALAVGAWHLAAAPHPRAEAQTLASVTVLGGVWDSLLAGLGYFHYPSSTFGLASAPHWLIALWLLFATTLNVSLRWLHRRYLLAAVLGALAGPAVFAGGRALGAVQFETLTPLVLQALGWALLLPAAVWLAARFDGYAGVRGARGARA